MEDFTNSALHLACVAGPDTARLLPLGAQWQQVGRDTLPTLRDRLTSRRHFEARIVRRRGQVTAQLRDCHSANGTHRLVPVTLVPGARPRCWWAKAGRARRQGASGRRRPAVGRPDPQGQWSRAADTSARRGEKTPRSFYLRPGQYLLAGSNVWQVRTLPASVSLVSLAQQYAPHDKARTWRWWYLIFPLMSLLWLASRWLPLSSAVLGLAILIGAGWYLHVWHRNRTRFHPDPASFALAAHLPPATSRERLKPAGGWEVNLTEAARITVTGGPYLRLVTRRYCRQRSEEFHPGATVGLRTNDPAWAPWIALQILAQTHQQGIGARVRAHPDDDQYRWEIRAGDEHLICLQVLSPVPADTHQVDHVVALAGVAPTTDLTAGAWFDSHHQEQEWELPQALSLAELDTIEAGENQGAHPPVGGPTQPGACRGLSACVGIGQAGPVTLDLVKDGPHALVAGTTGSGKSEALRTWLVQLVRRYRADALRLILIDYKGGATLAEFASLPHCEGLFTDLDVAATGRILYALGVELRRREAACVARGVRDISQWEELDPAGAPARLLCVIDEFRALTQVHPQLMEQCIDLAARGRSLGMHLIAATQSPAGVVSAQMRANLTLRVCLRTAQPADSFDVLGVDAAAHLPPIAGRALVDSGMGSQPVQWALAPAEREWAPPISAAGAAGGGTRIWQPPLDAVGAARWLAETVPQPDREDGGELSLGGGAFAVGECHRSGKRYALDTSAPSLVVGSPDARIEMLDRIAYRLGPHLRIVEEGEVGENTYAHCVRASTQDLVGTVLALRAAARADIPIVVDDLPRWWHQCDEQWGVGVGRKLWEQITARQRVLVLGAGLEEGARLRHFRRVLLCAQVGELREYGWDRQVQATMEDASAFALQRYAWVAVKWDEQSNLRAVVAQLESTNVSSKGALKAPALKPVEQALTYRALAEDLFDQLRTDAGAAGPKLYWFSSPTDLAQVGAPMQAACAKHGFTLEVITESDLLANPRQYRGLRQRHPLLVVAPTSFTCRALDLPLEINNECPGSQVWLVCRDESYRLSHLPH